MSDGGKDEEVQELPTFSLAVSVRNANFLEPTAGSIRTFVRATLKGGNRSAWWWGASDGDENSLAAVSQVCEGPVPAYGLVVESKPITLADDVINDLVNTTLEVAVVQGDERSLTAGVVIATASVPLAHCTNGAVSGEYELIETSDEFEGYAGSTIVIDVAQDEALVSHCTGGKLLTLTDVSLGTLPPQWLLGASKTGGADGGGPLLEDSTDILAMVQDPALNTARYNLTLQLPPGDGPRVTPLVTLPAAVDGDAEGKGEDEPAGQQVAELKVLGGRLDYAPLLVPEGDEEEDSKLEPEASAASTTYRWQIVWEDVNAFLSPSTIAQLKALIEAGGSLGVSIARIRCRALEEDQPEIGYDGMLPVGEDFLGRGEARLHVEDLLVPGTTCFGIDTAVGAVTVSEEEKAAAKEAAAKAAAEAEAAAAAAKKGKKGKAKGKGKPKAAEPELEESGAPALLDSDTRLTLSVNIDDPLIICPPTPPPPELKPSDLIPARPAPPANPPGAAASAEFRKQVTELAHQVAQEFVAVCRQLASEEGDIAHTTPETRRRALLRHLNEGGHYRAMKEKLKRSVVRIVRERFHKTKQDGDVQAQDTFIGELYTYLMGQVHRAINRVFAKANDGVAEAGAGATAAVPTDPTRTLGRLLQRVEGGEAAATGAPEEAKADRLKRMADEAEYLQEYSRAAKHHQDRVTTLESEAAAGKTGGYDASVWQQYAEFCLRQSDVPKAGECLRECVAISADSVPALLGLAAVQCVQGQFDRAEVMGKGAVALLDPSVPEDEEENKDAVAALPEPQSNTQVSANDLSVAHCLVSMIQERGGEEKTAGKSMQASIAAAQREDPDADAATAYLLGARYLLTLHLTELADKALSLARLVMLDSRPPTHQRVELLTLEARALAQRGESKKSLQRLDQVTDLDNTCSEAWAMRGKAMLAAGNITEARSAFELAVGDWTSTTGAAIDPTVLISLARIYLDQHVLGVDAPSADGPSLGESAKEVFLRAARECGWAAAWCGAGEAALRTGERSEAEAALCEANTRDNHNATVWGWLCLLCVTAKPLRESEAAQALEQCLKLGGTSVGLMEEIGAEYLALGKYPLAEGVLRRAVARGGSTHTQRLLGDALAAQNSGTAASDVYRAVLDGGADSADSAAAEAGLAAMQKLMGTA